MKKYDLILRKAICLLAIPVLLSSILLSCVKKDDAPDSTVGDLPHSELTESLPGSDAADAADSPFTVYENGKACRITVPVKKEEVQGFAEKLAFSLSQASGLSIQASYSLGTDDEPEIIVGLNACPGDEAAKLYASSNTGSWYIYRLGPKLLIWSADISGYSYAFDSLSLYITNYKKDSSLSFDRLFYGRKQYFKTDFELPAVSDLSASYINHVGGIDTSLTDVAVGYEKTPKAAFEAFVAGLPSAGFELRAENTISGNQYRTFTKNGEMLTVIYYPTASLMRIIAEPEYETPFWNFPSGERKGDVRLMMIKDETGEHASAFVITLADGRYFIFDTGVTSTYRQLFEYMDKNNRFDDGFVHIAAIMISHPHTDHMGGLAGLANTYGSKIVCDAVMYNLVSNEMQSTLAESTLNERQNIINNAAAKLKAKVYCVRAGQKFDLAGTSLEILFTPDELGNFKLTGVNSKGETDTTYDMNNSSLVVMLTESGQQVVFTGDCRGGEAGIISNLFSRGFPGDIMAVAHHGFNVSGTGWLYKSARPSVLLWTIKYADVDRTRAFVKTLEAADYVKKHFYEDEQVELILPYTP